MLEAPSPPQLLENSSHFQSIDKQIVLPHQECFQCHSGLQLPNNTYTMIVTQTNDTDTRHKKSLKLYKTGILTPILGYIYLGNSSRLNFVESIAKDNATTQCNSEILFRRFIHHLFSSDVSNCISQPCSCLIPS